MAPIKLEPGEGIDLHAQGLVLISREFAVNRSAPEKAKRRQKLFFLHVSFRATTYSIYLSIPAHVPRPMTELPGIVARVLCHPSPHPFFQLPGSGRPPLLSPGGWLGSLSCTANTPRRTEYIERSYPTTNGADARGCRGSWFPGRDVAVSRQEGKVS